MKHEILKSDSLVLQVSYKSKSAKTWLQSFKALVSLKRLTWISSFFTYRCFEPQIIDFCKISWLFLQSWKIFDRKTWFTNTLTHGNMDLGSSDTASFKALVSLKWLNWISSFFNFQCFEPPNPRFLQNFKIISSIMEDFW